VLDASVTERALCQSVSAIETETEPERGCN
jgi:hypothetical protein